MIKTLWQELQEQGFPGSYKSVWMFVRNWPLPAGMTPTSSSSSGAASTRRGAPVTRTPGLVKWLLLRKPEELRAQDAAIGRHCFVFLRAFRLFPPSARILFAWSVSVKARHSFLGWREPKGAPMRNCDALLRGWRESCQRFKLLSTLPWSTGQVEGQITMLKLLKRQMYGRAHIDLLRLRVLHAA